MKVDKTTLLRLTENLASWTERKSSLISSLIQETGEQESVDEIMSMKKTLLTSIINGLPMGSPHCYFCLLHNDNCSNCEYAATHQSCNSATSDYYSVRSARASLRDVILLEYTSPKGYDVEIDEDAKRRLVRNLMIWSSNYFKESAKHIKLASNSTSAEQVMLHKRELLYSLLRLPLGHNQCYFCLIPREGLQLSLSDCESCGYGKVHGICQPEDSPPNSYSKVFSAATALRALIKSKYYSGETYNTKR